MLTDKDSDLGAVAAVRQLPDDDKVAIGYAAAQLSCVIEASFPGLDTDRIENLTDDRVRVQAISGAVAPLAPRHRNAKGHPERWPELDLAPRPGVE